VQGFNDPDIMREDYSQYNVVYVPEGYGKIRFSRVEITHILISMLAMTAIFALAFEYSVQHTLGVNYLTGMLYALAIAAGAVTLGFLIHELGHKFVAQRYGAWAEFRMFPMGLLLGFVMSFIGFVIVAPGAVYIQGNITKRQNGLISLAGPATNIVIGSVFLLAWISFPLGALGYAFNILAIISLTLGIFNLIPFPPLDWEKIARWNIPVYLLTVDAAAALLYIAYFVNF
jgi:Zn-dependent protease